MQGPNNATNRIPEAPQQHTPGHHRPMTEPDPILQRMEAFGRENGGGMSVRKSRAGYTLTLTATQAPIA